ncbi:hypothetical protein COT42_00750 [Candidatus Saganbacteria bacterium CG08_land_8_20_14_0_20_45_16]|uniref:Membrane insertase YidC/Oxa/ALB C-terminal domain-containing protein n=1 Tax=Candidatus Saganbacteria bacterium CG08_land_8_20_14_0_20_45_16 TaxID=2014293 RepID=A0A2H0Y1P5_UNCSA|nr:MAG: hypothetical protein COT42_00750 [Candidatus Saganbacteria bacterium CG08_land_8_20_14_0_20_45_16]
MEFLLNIMVEALKFFAFFGGYGWGIIWLTVAVNLALYPLTLASIKSMGAMQRMQPKMQDLQKKHKDDPKELQKATMDLYRSEGVNPVGGCLPMLLKIPFFLALFWAFQSTAFLEIASNPANNTSFLWINGRVSITAFASESLADKLAAAKLIVLDHAATDMGKYYVWNVVAPVDTKKLKDLLWTVDAHRVDDIKKVREGLAAAVPGISDDDATNIIIAWNATNSLAKPERVMTPFGPLSILAILVGISTYFMQKTMPSAGAGQQAQMMTLFMPVFLVFICWNFPAGVQLYWLVSNAVAALQQYFIMRKA